MTDLGLDLSCRAKSPDARRRTARALAWAAAFSFCAVGARGILDSSRGVSLSASERGAEGGLNRGEALLHGIRIERAAWSMPLAPLVEASLADHLPGWAGTAALGVLWLGAIGLVLASGAGLHSLACGGLALLGLLSASPGIDERGLFNAVVLLVAACLVEDARRPSLSTALALAAALAVSLLIRSELFVFPPLFALYRGFFGKRRADRRELFCLSILPFLALIPWAYMNYAAYGKLGLFESGRADSNIIAGALGLVQTIEGQFQKVAGLPPGRSALLWAVGETARHPFRFLTAYLARAIFAVKQYPLAFLLAAGACWRLREKEGVRRLGVLAVYYVGVHCLMPVEGRYFVPIEPVLALLAAAFVFSWMPPDKKASPLTLVPIRVSLAVFSVLGGLTLAVAAAYPGRSSSPDRLSSEISAHPDDAWLLRQRGEARLGASDPDGAASDFQRALTLRPDARTLVDEAWALTVKGRDPAALVPFEIGPDAPLTNFDMTKAGLLKMLFELESGREMAAASAWRSAWVLWAETDCYSRGSSPASLEMTSRLRSVDARLFDVDLRTLLVAWPLKRRAALLGGIVRVFGRAEAFSSSETRRTYLSAARSALNEAEGDLEEARRALKAAESESPIDRTAAREEQAYRAQSLGEYARAFAILDEIVKSHPELAKAWSDRGVANILMGRREDAARDLSRALKLDADYLPACLTLGNLDAAEGRLDEARGLFDRALARKPSEEQRQTWEEIRLSRKKLETK